MTTRSIDEKEEARRGKMLADILGLRMASNVGEDVHYHTDWGSKTPLGLYRTCKRIIEEVD